MTESNADGRFRITFITNVSMAGLPPALASIRSKYGDILDVGVLQISYVDSGTISGGEAYGTMMSSDALLCEIMGNNKAYEILKKVYADSTMPIVSLIGSTPDIIALTRLGAFSMKSLPAAAGKARVGKLNDVLGMLKPMLSAKAYEDAKNWVQATMYWHCPAEPNLENLLLLVTKGYGSGRLGQDVLDAIRVEPPVELPDYGIMMPGSGKVYYDALEYLMDNGYDPSKPVVGILYYGEFHYDVCVTGVNALVRHLSGEANVVPVFTGGVRNLEPIEKYLNGPIKANAIISLIWFRLNGGPMGGDQERTTELLKKIGAPVFTPITMYTSDLKDWRAKGISMIETMAVVAFPEIDGCIEPIPIFGMEQLSDFKEVRVSVAIEDRASRISKRILNLVSLQRKRNKDKKIALVIYDYPPGEATVGSAAYLDTFKSVEAILKALAERGYTVKPCDGLKEMILSAGAVNEPGFLRHKAVTAPGPYLEWYGSLPGSIRKDVESLWGPPPGDVMAGRDGFIIPAIDLGNVAVCVQPGRGRHSSKNTLYHDKSLPPHHQYMAFYQYLRDTFKADAIVHVGTHGTLEFLPGKEAGMSDTCYPDILIGDVPHFYVYHASNPSEAAIAKRRSYATLIDYAPPEFTNSGLYGEFLRLEDMLSVASDSSVAGGIREDTLAGIGELCRRLGMEFKDTATLHEDLEAMKSSLIPYGLHVLGEPYDEASLARLLLYIIRRSGENNEGFESWCHGEDAALATVTDFCVRGLSMSEVPDELKGLLENAKSIKEKIRASDEIGSLMEALEGKYVMPNIAGDPVRTPEIFPTGRNSYAFDPKQIPAKAAYLRGVKIAENTLEAFYRENGRYPETVGVILWGFETAKTRGETVGQILAYMGLKVTRGKSWYPGVEAMTLEELGRPRIDVNVNICGFFRDMYPNLIKLIGEGVEKVAALDEDISRNYVKKHCEEIRASAKGPDTIRLSTARIFGPAAGEYGTGITGIVEASAWENESDLSGKYADSMSHAYGPGVSGVPCSGLFKKMLSMTEMVSQVRDSTEYEVSDLDHYYEFLGGLAKSVETASGKKPGVLVSDTTAEKIRTVTACQAIVKGVYTRLLNPAWIDGMLRHDFHGAENVADRVENLIGFAATVGVSGAVFQNVAERLVFDERTLEALKKNNAFAARNIAYRLMEAEKRGYWAPDEKDKERLVSTYLKLEGDIEEGTSARTEPRKKPQTGGEIIR